MVYVPAQQYPFSLIVLLDPNKKHTVLESLLPSAYYERYVRSAKAAVSSPRGTLMDDEVISLFPLLS
jgi:hypothetical protein